MYPYSVLRGGQVVGKMLGKQAENKDDGSIEVLDATFHTYPSPQEVGAKAAADEKLGAPIATVKAGKMIWFRKAEKITLSDGVDLSWLADSREGANKRMTMTATSADLKYSIGGPKEASQLSLTKTKSVVFNGLELQVDAPTMDIDIEIGNAQNQTSQSAEPANARGTFSGAEGAEGRDGSFPARIH